MAKQTKFTLTAYHGWAVERIAKTLGAQRSDVINQAVSEWLNNHAPNEVAGSRASVAEFAAYEDSRRNQGAS